MVFRKHQLFMSLGVLAFALTSSHGFALDDRPLPLERDESGPEIKLGVAGLHLSDGKRDPKLSGFHLSLGSNNIRLNPSLNMKAYYGNTGEREQTLYAFSAGISPLLTRLNSIDLYGNFELGLISEKVSSDTDPSFQKRNSPYTALGLTLSARPWRTSEGAGLGLFANSAYLHSFSSEAVTGIEFAAGVSWQTSEKFPFVAK